MDVYAWLKIVGILGFVTAINWSVWRRPKWGYYPTIGLVAVGCIIFEREILHSSKPSELYLVALAPVIMFLILFYFISVCYLLDRDPNNQEAFYFFLQEIRKKRTPTIFDWFTILIGYTAFALILAFGGLTIYFDEWG